MTNLDSIFKSRDITLPTKICLVKAMVFPVVIYGCETWTVKKAESQRTDAFELWCWRRLLRVPWRGNWGRGEERWTEQLWTYKIQQAFEKWVYLIWSALKGNLIYLIKVFFFFKHSISFWALFFPIKNQQNVGCFTTADTVSLFIVTGRIFLFPRQPEVSLINMAPSTFMKHSIDLMRFQNWEFSA